MATLTLAHLYLVAACYGLLKMVSLAGFPAMIPAYVPDQDLPKANALESLSFGLSSAAGAAIAALALPVAGAPALLAVDAVSYLFSGQLGAGLAGYGLLVSAVTVGELAGSLGAGASTVRRLGPAIVAAQLAAAALLAALLLRPPLAPTLVLLAAFGAMTTPMTAWAQTLRMRLVPAPLHGRLFALLRTVMQATPPLGAGLAAVTIPHGLGPTVLAVVAVMAVPALLAAPGLLGREVRPAGSPSR